MLNRLVFEHNVFMDPEYCFRIILTMDGNHRIQCNIESSMYYGSDDKEPYFIKPEDCKKITDLIDDCSLWTWNKEYHPEGYDVLDGFGWELEYEDTNEIIGANKKKLSISGDNAYPWCFYKLIRALIIAAPELKDKLEEYAIEKQPVY